MSERPLRPGDVVEVVPASQILATLDDRSAMDGTPFMPEMVERIGGRFTVSRRVDKICDTVSGSGNRRTRSMVFLEDMRCDGSAHDGCQAGCRIYWRDAWLRRVRDDDPVDGPGPDEGEALERLRALAISGVRTKRRRNGEMVEAWRCQATDALEFSTPLRHSDPRQYFREARNGNHTFTRFLRLMVRGVFFELGSRLGVMKPLPLQGPGKETTDAVGIKAGDRVQVRSPREIRDTLDGTGMNRGLSFDREMLPYCGRTMIVRDRVNKIIDDRTGRMLRIPKDSLILEGAVCSGERTLGCYFCPRGIYPFWRESWVRILEQAGEVDGGTGDLAAPAAEAPRRTGRSAA